MEENMGMKSTLINERVLGSRGSLAGDAPDSKSRFQVGLATINQELWLVLSLFVIAGLFNWLVASHRMILGLYTLPTIFSAYVYGRRHAVLTASASIFMVLILLWRNTGLFAGSARLALNFDQWSELVTWACLLLITAYAMGTLYDRTERHLGELRQTYFGLLTTLGSSSQTINTRTTTLTGWRSMPHPSPRAWDFPRIVSTTSGPPPCSTT
jgi:hypothetical protein